MTQENHLVSPTLPALPKSGPTHPFFRPARAFGDTLLFLHSSDRPILLGRALPAPFSSEKNTPTRTSSRSLYLQKTNFLGQKVDCPADVNLVTPSYHANSPPECPTLSRLSHRAGLDHFHQRFPQLHTIRMQHQPGGGQTQHQPRTELRATPSLDTRHALLTLHCFQANKSQAKRRQALSSIGQFIR